MIKRYEFETFEDFISWRYSNDAKGLIYGFGKDAYGKDQIYLNLGNEDNIKNTYFDYRNELLVYNTRTKEWSVEGK